MSKSKINIAEIRRLAARVAKKRPILEYLKIKDGKAYFTDSAYLVEMGGYEDSEDILINLSDYSTTKRDIYPNLENIMSGKFQSVAFKDVIVNGKVEHEITTEKGTVAYIDHFIKDQIKKLVAVKNFEFDITKIKVKTVVCLLEINEDTKIYFSMRRRQTRNEN